MLSNAYFLAKFRFHTAENEPAKNFAKHFPVSACLPTPDLRGGRRPGAARAPGRKLLRRGVHGVDLRDLGRPDFR